MNDDEYEVTIGTGGWILVVLSGGVTFGVLRWLMGFLLFPSVVFGIAIALIVLLLLYWLAGKVGTSDEDEARQVRRIVPAAAEVRSDGAMGPAVKAVPMRPDALKSQRQSSVVTPLAEVGPAPIIAQPILPDAKPAAPVAALAEPVAKTAAATPKAKAVAKPKVGSKPGAKAKPEAMAKPKAEAQPKLAVKAAPTPVIEAKPKVAKPAALPKAESAAKAEKPAAKPKAAKPKAEKPAGLVRLKAPRKGRADELQEIEGIGPALEKLVNGMGFYHFDQIAAWTPADVATVDAEMKTFKGRIARDKWVEQARIIVSEGLAAFRERARTNDY